jgi:hypothetical protein
MPRLHNQSPSRIIKTSRPKYKPQQPTKDQALLDPKQAPPMASHYRVPADNSRVL